MTPSAAVKGEAETKREAWIDERVEEIGGDEARGTAIRALDFGTLGADFLIEVEVDGKLEKIAVATILADRERWNLARTRDPIEPGYDGGRVTGKLFLLQLRPQLFSFAHGGRTYALTRTMRTIEVAPGFLREAVDETIEVLRADPLTFDFGGRARHRRRWAYPNARPELGRLSPWRARLLHLAVGAGAGRRPPSTSRSSCRGNCWRSATPGASGSSWRWPPHRRSA